MDGAPAPATSAPSSEPDGAFRPPNAAAASLALWVFLLAFGGGCLTLYYTGIHYIPEIAWDQSLTYLGVVSIIGGCLLALFGLLEFLPGLIWSEFLISDIDLQGALNYRRASCDWEPCLLRIGRRLALPFAVLIGSFHFGLCRGHIFWAALVAMLLGILLFVATAGWLGSPEEETSPPSSCTCPPAAPAPCDHCLRGSIPSRRARYVGAFALSGAFGLASLTATYYIVGAGGLDWKLGTICEVVVVASNVFVAMLFSKHPRGAVVIAFVAASTLLVAGELIERDRSLVNRIMEHFGVGRESMVSLVVKHDAFDILRGQNVLFTPGPSGATARVDDVAMLSRLGKDYFLRYGRCRLTLPKEMVLSWSTLDPPPQVSSPRPGVPPAPPPAKPGSPCFASAPPASTPR